MTFSVGVGSFVQPGATGNQSVTVTDALGNSFQPKAVLFFSSGQIAAGIAASWQRCFGLAVSSSSRAVVAVSNITDTGGNANIDTRQDNLHCISFIDSSATVLAEADFVQMETDGFTVEWEVVDATARIVNYVAFGGADCTNAAILEITSPTGVGVSTYSGLAFRPDLLFAINASMIGAPPNNRTSGNGGIGLGWAFGPSNQAVAGAGAGTSDNGGSGYVGSDAFIGLQNTSFTYLTQGALTEFTGDGFKVNWTDVEADARYSWVLCLQGGKYSSGRFILPTGTGEVTYTSGGIRPRGLLMMVQGFDNSSAGGGDDPANASDGNVEVTWGAANDAARQRSIGANHTDPTHVDSNHSATRVAELLSSGAAPAVTDSFNLVIFNANGSFTINHTVATGPGRAHWLVIGDQADGDNNGGGGGVGPGGPGSGGGPPGGGGGPPHGGGPPGGGGPGQSRRNSYGDRLQRSVTSAELSARIWTLEDDSYFPGDQQGHISIDSSLIGGGNRNAVGRAGMRTWYFHPLYDPGRDGAGGGPISPDPVINPARIAVQIGELKGQSQLTIGALEI